MYINVLCYNELSKENNMIYTRIKELRIQHHYTQKQVANDLGLSRSTYSNMENGKTRVSIKILLKLAVYYNTSVDYLIGLTKNPVPHGRKYIQ